jgi:hypothetical protein
MLRFAVLLCEVATPAVYVPESVAPEQSVGAPVNVYVAGAAKGSYVTENVQNVPGPETV